MLVESGDIVHEEVISTEPIGQSPLVNIAIDRLFDDHDLESSEQQLKFLYQQIARKLKKQINNNNSFHGRNKLNKQGPL